MPGSDARVATMAELYSSEAEGYLEVYSPLLLPFQRELLGLVGASEARRILDLGTGPGTAIPDIRATAPGAVVVAADRAIGMIALAPADSPRVALDAMDLPFAEGAFDVVCMAFMAFHLPDPNAGFAEVARVLAPGGRLGVATWGADETIGAAWSVWEEELDRVHAPEGPRHGLPDYRSLGTPADLGACLERAGFTSIRFHTGRWTFRPSHEEFMAFMSKHVVARRLGLIDEAQVQACTAAVDARTRHLPASQLGLDAEVLFAVASR